MKKILYWILFHSVALIPSSCVKVRFGECIRSSTAVHAGVVGLAPFFQDDNRYWVDGVYTYEYASEVTYRRRPSIMTVFALKDWPLEGTFDVTLTGRKVLVESKSGHLTQVRDSLPPHAEMRLDNVKKDEWVPREHSCAFLTLDYLKKDDYKEGDVLPITPPDRFLGDFSTPQSSRGSLSAQILAAPFDFCIDPALSLAASPLYPIWLPLYGLYYSLLSDDSDSSDESS
ncbi:MAG: hypothetical protein LUG84_00565 [Akkermansiaceae bacterium]|nr:hypothetical protein [Akkermansiaceae bacterium]